jgi:hypothetical protein
MSGQMPSRRILATFFEAFSLQGETGYRHFVFKLQQMLPSFSFGFNHDLVTASFNQFRAKPDFAQGGPNISS